MVEYILIEIPVWRNDFAVSGIRFLGTGSGSLAWASAELNAANNFCRFVWRWTACSFSRSLFASSNETFQKKDEVRLKAGSRPWRETSPSESAGEHKPGQRCRKELWV